MFISFRGEDVKRKMQAPEEKIHLDFRPPFAREE
jgi:hypothetical protein